MVRNEQLFGDYARYFMLYPDLLTQKQHNGNSYENFPNCWKTLKLKCHVALRGAKAEKSFEMFLR